MRFPSNDGFMTECFERWLSRIETALLYLGVLATFGMMCLTSADAFSRYLFNSPILGAMEITEKYLMVAAIFLGLSYSYRGGLFIRVTLFVDKLSGRARLIADYFAHAVTLAFCIVMLLATVQQAARGWRDNTELSTLPLLVGPSYSLVPIGFLAITILLLIDLTRVRQGRSLLLTQEAPSA
jgi:TRAP-type C4-dicarboxylate transport system permease small subunit